MDVSNAVRQVEEILNFKDQWYGDAIEVKTPALFQRLQKVRSSAKNQLEVKKCLAFNVKCAILYPDELPNLLLAFEFPIDYPSENRCRVRALYVSDPQLEYKSCTAAIERYLDAFYGCECVESVMDWLSKNNDSCLNETESENDIGAEISTDNDRYGKVQCYILRYNHLLSGPEHKKEKSMLSAAKKSKLQGGLLWGTPGVVVIVPPSTQDDSKEYALECRILGKRPDGVDEIWLPLAGIEEAGLGGLAQQKRGGKMQELDTAALRTTCGEDEDLLRAVLGL